MIKLGFKPGDKVRVIKDYSPSSHFANPISEFEGKEAIFKSYWNNHPSGYQYEVVCGGEDIVVWDIEKIESKESKKETNMKEMISIGIERLREYFDASTPEQKKYLNTHFNLFGECTKESLIGLRDIACSAWKPIIEKNHPEVFKIEGNWEDKWIQPSNEQLWIVANAMSTGFASFPQPIGSNRKPRHAFKTLEQADLMVEKCKLMVEMQNFAAVHNEGWKPDWERNVTYNFGIIINGPKSTPLRIDGYDEFNSLVFGIAVKSREIAEKMLEEFGERIKQFLQ